MYQFVPSKLKPVVRGLAVPPGFAEALPEAAPLGLELLDDTPPLDAKRVPHPDRDDLLNL